MSEAIELTTAIDRARGRRRYRDADGYEWTEDRSQLAKPDDDPACPGVTGIPKGFRPVSLLAFTDGRRVVIPEQPALMLPDETIEGDHDCDANGCGWEHVMAQIVLPRVAPEPIP